MRKTKYLNSNMNLLGKHTINSTSTDMLNYHCQIGSVADNAENVTQNQNFIYFPVGFSFISRTTNNLKLEIRLDSMQKSSKSTEMVNYYLQIGSVSAHEGDTCRQVSLCGFGYYICATVDGWN